MGRSRVGGSSFVVAAVLLSLCPPAWACQDEPKKKQDPRKKQTDDPFEELYFDEKAIFEKVPDVTTPTRTKRTVKRASSAVTVLTGEQIRRTGWPTLSDAMRTVPGVEVMRTFSTESNVAFRGFNGAAGTSSGVLLMIDGRQVYIDFSGENNWDNLPISLEDIDRVEIVRGPGSFLYGPNALHGVVNIITKRPREMMSGEADRWAMTLSTTLGSYSTVVSTLRAAYWDKDWGARLSVGWNDVAEFEDRDSRIKELGFANALVRREFGEKHGIEAALVYHDGKYNTVRSSNLGVDLRRGYGKVNYWLEGLQAQVIVERLKADLENIPNPNLGFTVPLVPKGTTVEQTYVNLDVHYSRDVELWGTHTLTAGAGLIFTRAGSDDVTDGLRDQWRPAVYVQDEWALLENLFLTVGVRFDYHPEAGADWSPQGGIVYSPDPDHRVRASVKTGFRNPSYVESFVNLLSDPFGPGVQIKIIPNDGLKSERMLSFELGYSGLWFKKLKTGVDLFYNRLDDLIEFNTLTAPPVSTRQFQNVRDATVYGIELSLEYLITNTVSVWGNVSWQRVEDRDTGDRLPDAPRVKANLGVRGSFPSVGLFADVWVNYFDDVEITIDSTTKFPIDSRLMVNARLAWRLWEGRVELFASVVNINDDKHREHPQGEEFGRAFYIGFQVNH